MSQAQAHKAGGSRPFCKSVRLGLREGKYATSQTEAVLVATVGGSEQDVARRCGGIAADAALAGCAHDGEEPGVAPRVAKVVTLCDGLRVRGWILVWGLRAKGRGVLEPP